MTTLIAPAPASAATAAPATQLALVPSDSQAAAKLLHQFDARALGEGDLSAGANTLAMMALALANSAPPRSCLADDKEGMRIPVGMGMLVSGSLSCDLLDDRVLAVLHASQNHLYGHIRDWMEKNKIKEHRAAATGVIFPNDTGVAGSRWSPFERLDHVDFADFHEPDDMFRELLRPPKSPGTREIRDLPVMFAAVGSADTLKSVLNFAHRGRPLLHASLSDDGDPALLAKVCGEVMSGCPTRALLDGSISGQVIVTDPLGMLGDLVCGDGKGAGWLHRLLWLGDHETSPAFEMAGDANFGPKLLRTGGCFESALETVAAKRLNFNKPDPMQVVCEFSRGQTTWNAFLRGLEPRFPGITGTLRPLPASLAFGLLEMIKASEQASRPQLAMDAVTAFAQLLALRMVNAREMMVQDGRRQRLESLAASIRLKLADGPLQIREIMRKSHRLDAATCQEVLERLADSGLVVRSGSQWKLAPSKQRQALTLDV